jgi:hypothetical protein
LVVRSSRVGRGIGARSATTNNEANPLKSSDSRSPRTHGSAPPQFTRALGGGFFGDRPLPPRAARRVDLSRRRDRDAEGGAGIATSTLSDDGIVAHGAQSLLVAPRSA